MYGGPRLRDVPSGRKTLSRRLILFVSVLFTIQGHLYAQESKLILAHYMPWYQSKEFSGTWGWHWTMNQFSPDKLENGRAQIASHFHPLIGPYDSNDPHAIECHVQLMKLSGIDGVIIDWYGIHDFRDYAPIHRNTKRLIEIVRQANMRYAICYEDQSLKHHANQKKLDRNTWTKMAQQDFAWMDKNCFGDKAYVTVKGQPLLLVFGPQFLETEDWNGLRKSCKRTPAILGLPHLVAETRMDGSFGWPPVHGGKLVSRKDWIAYLDRLESRVKQQPTAAIVFPGFRDIYQQAKVSPSYGAIQDENGRTFEDTLERALKSKADLIQIATWNDFGEGTNIEPTHEYGFRYLKMLQSSFSNGFKVDDLRLPIKLYQARKKTIDEDRKRQLDQVSMELLKGHTELASKILRDQ